MIIKQILSVATEQEYRWMLQKLEEQRNAKPKEYWEGHGAKALVRKCPYPIKSQRGQDWLEGFRHKHGAWHADRLGKNLKAAKWKNRR